MPAVTLRSRPWLLLTFGFAILFATVLATKLTEIRSCRDIDSPQAFRLAQAHRVLLVDIRTSGERHASGIPAGAIPLDMRDPNFIERLKAMTGGRMKAPVALICASGGRSTEMAERLRAGGFSRVSSVRGGVSGSWLDRGWIAAGLPLKPG